LSASHFNEPVSYEAKCQNLNFAERNKMKLTLIFSSMFLACSIHAATVAELQAEIVQLQKQVAVLQPLAALVPYVQFDPATENGLPGPHITFSGVNIHVNNRAGATASSNGLGNLIVGFDELPTQRPFYTYSRGGSHNLIVGPQHSFYAGSWGNVIGGSQNIAFGQGEVIAGYLNQVSGLYSSVLGGVLSIGSGEYSVVLGGQGNQAIGLASVVLGGYDNQEQSWYCTLLGGENTIDTSPEFTVVQ
jgi:hypothetical protein